MNAAEIQRGLLIVQAKAAECRRWAESARQDAIFGSALEADKAREKQREHEADAAALTALASFAETALTGVLAAAQATQTVFDAIQRGALS